MSLLRNILPIFARKTLRTATQTAQRSFHYLSGRPITNDVNGRLASNNLLAPRDSYVQQSCGFKVKGKLRKRCKDCYFVMRHERLYVICESEPRHKQMSMVKDPKNTWMLTHATQSKVRPW